MSAIDLSPFRQTGKSPFNIAEQPTEIDKIYEDKKDYKNQLEDLQDEIDELQNMMYAHDRYGLLCVFQAMDAAGKDGTVRRVFSGVNPHGVEIHAFKKPSAELKAQKFQEFQHDYPLPQPEVFDYPGRYIDESAGNSLVQYMQEAETVHLYRRDHAAETMSQ